MHTLKAGTEDRPVLFRYNGDYSGLIEIVVERVSVTMLEGSKACTFIKMEDLEKLVFEKYRNRLMSRLEQQNNMADLLQVVLSP